MCHYNPCTNTRCPYKHAPGQNRSFDSYSWTPKKADDDQHLSDRKFVDGDAGPEELIKPDQEMNGGGQEGVAEVQAPEMVDEIS